MRKHGTRSAASPRRGFYFIRGGSVVTSGIRYSEAGVEYKISWWEGLQSRTHLFKPYPPETRSPSEFRQRLHGSSVGGSMYDSGICRPDG